MSRRLLQPPKPSWDQAVARCLVAVVACLVVGCTRSPYAPPGATPYPPIAQAPAGSGAVAAAPPTGPASVYANQQTSPQLIQLQQQVQNLSTDNRQLTSQIAQLQQQLQVLTGQNQLLTQQLQDSVSQYRSLASSSQQLADQARDMQAAMNNRGGARLTANNSVSAPAAGVQISGAQVVQDGNRIRIRLPADRLFAPGTSMIGPGGTTQLDEVASVILARFGRQRIVVEGHTDAGGRYGGSSAAFRLSGEQAQAVVDQLVQRNRLPLRQFAVAANGPNYPLADNSAEPGRAVNRRVEIVIYPDAF